MLGSPSTPTYAKNGSSWAFASGPARSLTNLAAAGVDKKNKDTRRWGRPEVRSVGCAHDTWVAPVGECAFFLNACTVDHRLGVGLCFGGILRPKMLQAEAKPNQGLTLCGCATRRLLVEPPEDGERVPKCGHSGIRLFRLRQEHSLASETP